MSGEPKTEREPILEDYQKDAEHLIRLYCNPKLPAKNSGLHIYKTRGLLKEYVELKKFTPQQVDLIIGLVRATSKSMLDPYSSKFFKQKLFAKRKDARLLQLVRDLAEFGNDPFFHYEVDLKFIKDPGRFQQAELWATGGYINNERKWFKQKGRLGTFLRVLMDMSVLHEPKKGIKVKEILKYFNDRYGANLTEDSIKPKFTKKHADEFKEPLMRAIRPASA